MGSSLSRRLLSVFALSAFALSSCETAPADPKRIRRPAPDPTPPPSPVIPPKIECGMVVKSDFVLTEDLVCPSEKYFAMVVTGNNVHVTANAGVKITTSRAIASVLILGDGVTVDSLTIEANGVGTGILAYNTTRTSIFANKVASSEVGIDVYQENRIHSDLILEQNDITASRLFGVRLNGEKDADKTQFTNPLFAENTIRDSAGYAIAIMNQKIIVRGDDNNRLINCHHGLYLRGPEQVQVSNIDFSDVISNAIHIYDSDHVELTNVSTKGNEGAGFLIDDALSVAITNLTCEGKSGCVKFYLSHRSTDTIAMDAVQVSMPSDAGLIFSSERSDLVFHDLAIQNSQVHVNPPASGILRQAIIEHESIVNSDIP